MKELKLLKGLLKKRTKLTLSTLVIFLITGSIGYSIEITENFINEGSIVEIDGNGVNISSVGINIINSGIISGESITSTSSTFSGNGVYSRSSIGTITNSGIISGESTSSTSSSFSGNGVSTRSSIGTITNSGIIGGKSTSPSPSSGNGVYSNSSIEIITNSGIISGGSDISSSGNGVYSSSSIGTITNSGIISGGWSNTGTVFLGNGVYSNSVDIINSGIISGESISSNYYSGNGVYNNTNISLGDITNSGIISGESTSSTFSGNGVSTRSSIGTITNSGIIKGSNKSIQGNYISLTNNGILAGKQIHDISGVYTNNGIEILIDSTGNITNIENGLEGEVTFEDGTIKNIINGNIDGNDSFTLANDGSKFENNIINGAGIDKGALIVNPNSEIAISNSIVNGYSTAIYLESDSKITSTDTIFNGGGLKNDIAVIKGDDGDNSLNILGNSIINGAVDLGNGTDTLAIANTVQINGNLDGGAGNQDTLNLGEVQTAKAIDSPNLNLLHDITGFESINTNGNITLFETVNLTGAENINLESGNLVLRVDPTVTTDGKVIGHALYGNNGILTSSGGNLVIGLNGLGEGAIISMGGTTITLETNDSWWKDTDHIKTNSLVLDGKLSADGKDINITVLESIPLGPSTPVPPINPEPPIDPPVDPPIDPEPPIDPPAVVDSLLYEKLNKVYQSIVSAEEIGNLANTTLLEDKTYNDSLGGLLTILDQIYANNPYAYSLKSSRDSLKLFEDNMSYLTIKPKKDEMIVQGKAIYTGVKNDSSASGKNYYGFDTGHRNYKTTTNTVGGLATFEYGLSDDASVGIVFGGNNQDVNFKGSSKIKGNSLYLGTFAKTDINNFKFMSGVGYQYTSADADRRVSNRYDSFSTGDKYDINSLNVFVEAKYVYNAEQDWTVEPKVRLSYYYIDQDKVNEGYTPGQISMKTDTVNSNTADVEVGVDFVKSLYLNNGKLKNILSLGVINTIGDKSKELNGYILGKEKDGKKFDIQGVELPKTSGKVSYNLELEQINGMIYTAGVSLEFAKDYNRNINATVGIGYKF